MSQFGSSGNGTASTTPNSNSTTNMMNSSSAINGGGGTGDAGATMSRKKFSPIAKTLRKNTLRAKEMMLNKFNKNHDRTADQMFDDYAVQIQKQHVVATRFSKELKNYVACVRAMANASKMLNIVMRDEAFEPAWHGNSQFIATTHANEAIWNDYCDLLNSQLLPTTQLYLDQFAAIQARIAKRNRKLVDFDGARHELAAAEAAKKRDEQKILKAEEFLTQTKFTFENLNDELRRHMPRVRDSRVLFYSKTMHDLADMEQKFHAKLSASQQINVSVLEKLLEEAEAGQYKTEWRSESVRTAQRTATFQNNFHKRQQQSVGVVNGPNLSVVMMESDDLRMSAPPATASSSSRVADKSAAYTTNDDDEPDNNNNGGDFDADDYAENSSVDSDVSHDDDRRQSSSSAAGKKAVNSRASSSSTGGGGGFSGAASRMRNAIVAKANGVLNNINVASGNNISKRDDSSGVEDDHVPGTSNGNALFPEGGGVDAEDAAAAAIEFKGIRRLDDDGVPTRDTPTTTSSRRPPLPPAPSAQLRQQQQQQQQQQQHQRQQSLSSSSTSSAAAVHQTTTQQLAINSSESVATGGCAAAGEASENNNVTRVVLRQTNSISAAEQMKLPATKNESDLTLTNPASAADMLLKNRKLLYRARATHAYKGEDVDELSFSAGEMIYVIEYENPDDQDVGWQMGIRAATGDMGVFPENFTRVLMNGNE